MGTLACILKEMGYKVSGSDQNVYPPMSDFLIEKGIQLFEGYDPSNLDHDPDLVIIGNVVTKLNIEARAVLQKGIPYLSMPQALNKFIAKDKKIILVTGTHGKTTTSSIMAHILFTAGMDPSFMIGGILKDFNSSFRIGNGEYMVIEGDEYDTAFFDKGPKFMHYDPEITIMTGIEFDHADIFKGIDHIKAVFSSFVRKIEKNSHIIAFNDNDNLKDVLASCTASIETYGQKAQWFFSGHIQKNAITCFDVHGPGKSFSIETNMVGQHNIFNCLACIAAANKIGIDDKIVRQALKTFSGIKRRQEIRGVKNGITVMDDFAHHPTAVRETIKAVKPFYKKGRVIAVFEPRTNTSMRYFFQNIYPDSFLNADMVCICEPGIKKNIPLKDKFCAKKLVADIKKKGVEAYYFENTDAVINFLLTELRQNDLALIMSNGGFDNIHVKLLKGIKEKKEIKMSEIEKLEWDSKYSVGVEEIDTHQKKMFGLFNELIDLKKSEEDAKACINMISEINEYGKLYFSIEERYLKRKGYPDFGAHARVHRQFIKNSISLRREVVEDCANLTDDVIMELRNWLTDHILSFDSLYVPFLRINKYIEESKLKK